MQSLREEGWAAKRSCLHEAASHLGQLKSKEREDGGPTHSHCDYLDVSLTLQRQMRHSAFPPQDAASI